MKFLEQLRATLQLNDTADWTRYISTEDIHSHGGSGLLTHYGGSVHRLLASTVARQNTVISHRPKVSWRPQVKTQNRVEHLVKQLFEEQVISNYQLKTEGHRSFELDVY